jgi:hypothetical protein
MKKKRRSGHDNDIIVVDWPDKSNDTILLQTSSRTSTKTRSRHFYKTRLSAPLSGSLLQYADNLELTDNYDDLQVPLAPSMASMSSPVESILPYEDQTSPVSESVFSSDPSVAPQVAPEDYDPVAQAQPDANNQPDGLPLYDDDYSLSLLSIGESQQRKSPVLFEESAVPENFINVISSDSPAEEQEADWRDQNHYKVPVDAVEADANAIEEEWSMNEKPPQLVAVADVQEQADAKSASV